MTLDPSLRESKDDLPRRPSVRKGNCASGSKVKYCLSRPGIGSARATPQQVRTCKRADNFGRNLVWARCSSATTATVFFAILFGAFPQIFTRCPTVERAKPASRIGYDLCHFGGAFPRPTPTEPRRFALVETAKADLIWFLPHGFWAATRSMPKEHADRLLDEGIALGEVRDLHALRKHDVVSLQNPYPSEIGG